MIDPPTFRPSVIGAVFFLLCLFSGTAFAGWRGGLLTTHGGQYPSIAIDPSGNSHISTLDQNKPPASLLRHIIVDPHGHLMKNEIVDGDNAGWWSSIAVDSIGRVHVAYQEGQSGVGVSDKLRYAFFDGKSWTVHELEDGGCSTSIAVAANGLPHISHVGGFQCAGDLRHVWFDGTQWKTESTGQSGLWFSGTSIVMNGDGSVSIAFINSGRNVMLATNSAGKWAAEHVADEGLGVSLALDPSGGPHIVYTNEVAVELDYASRSGGIWSSETVFSKANEGSLAIDLSGTPDVSFANNIPGVLMYATRGSAGWKVTSLGGKLIGQTAIALDKMRLPHIAAQVGLRGQNFGLVYARETRR